MLDDLDWATADFERATTLMKHVTAADEPIDKKWRSGGFGWHLHRWAYRLPDGTSRGPIVPGRWDASLTAHSRNAAWSFSWTGEGWIVLDSCLRGVAKPPPD
jgi:hypothetical protein